MRLCTGRSRRTRDGAAAKEDVSTGLAWQQRAENALAVIDSALQAFQLALPSALLERQRAMPHGSGNDTLRDTHAAPLVSHSQEVMSCIVACAPAGQHRLVLLDLPQSGALRSSISVGLCLVRQTFHPYLCIKWTQLLQRHAMPFMQNCDKPHAEALHVLVASQGAYSECQLVIAASMLQW